MDILEQFPSDVVLILPRLGSPVKRIQGPGNDPGFGNGFNGCYSWLVSQC